MTIIGLIITLIIIGVCLYLLEQFVPMSEPFRIVIRILVVLIVCLLLLDAFGLYSIPLRIR